MQWRNAEDPDNPVPEDLLVNGTAGTLNYWLSLFVLETRKKDGSQYPCRTLNLLLAGLKRHMRAVNPYCVDILDPQFAGLCGVRDNVARELRRAGIGASVNTLK